MEPTTQIEIGVIHLDGATTSAPPSHLSDLKKALWKDELLHSWKEVLAEPEVAIEEISKKGGDVRVIHFTTGYPASNIQIYEMYESKGQVACREHPGVIETERYLLSLWHASWPRNQISLTIPVSYFDRVRIRQPGDTTFSLDPGYRGRSRWMRNYDAFDASPRLDAVQDMCNNSHPSCAFYAPPRKMKASFVCFLCSASQDEGILRVLSMLRLAIPYIIMRPFFRLNENDANEWVVDFDNPDFPGSLLGGKQFLTTKTHPHLRLDKTMVVPPVNPADQVYCHCDVVHEVEAHHYGNRDSSVIHSRLPATYSLSAIPSKQVFPARVLKSSLFVHKKC
ncbi:hypothetical protein J132_06408 [Termitomyces sp. J132]|nr:hypothetical protein J132_06408 [Termitomyces sp. J132]